MKNLKPLPALSGHWYQLKNLNYNKLINRIKENEGFSLTPYKDQLGYLTVGYGHLILPNEKELFKEKKTKTDLEKIFIQDFKKAVRDYNNFLKQNTFNKKEQELLVEMVFQIGVKGVLDFKKLLSNMRKKNKHLVCFEMMNSLWYKQTPERVKKLIKIFLENEQ